jgi:hypothetical protein
MSSENWEDSVGKAREMISDLFNKPHSVKDTVNYLMLTADELTDDADSRNEVFEFYLDCFSPQVICDDLDREKTHAPTTALRSKTIPQLNEDDFSPYADALGLKEEGQLTNFVKALKGLHDVATHEAWKVMLETQYKDDTEYCYLCFHACRNLSGLKKDEFIQYLGADPKKYSAITRDRALNTIYEIQKDFVETMCVVAAKKLTGEAFEDAATGNQEMGARLERDGQKMDLAQEIMAVEGLSDEDVVQYVQQRVQMALDPGDRAPS